MPERLGRAFFARDPVTLAQDLLGVVLVRVLDSGERLSGVIVETEAYLGVKDRAAHAFGGRRTARNESMYGQPGTAYVYFTYGMHHCVNVVCGGVDEPVAVLIRALEPREGLEAMAANRGRVRAPVVSLCSGPGKLCQAMAIDRELDGVDLPSDGRLFLEAGADGPINARAVRCGPRIGLGDVGVWASRRLRWWVGDSAHVSVRSGKSLR